jgi:hypothetical protein
MFNGLRFFCRFFQKKDRFQLTLLCMAAPDSNYFHGSLVTGQETQPVMRRSASSMLCRIEDIENEIGSDSYDALVMGRRGLNRLRDFTQQSLSHKLFKRHPGTPMILCRKPDLNRKNVLLCLDGSESSFSMARFVAANLKGESHMVTLCNIIKDTSYDRDNSIAIFKRGEEIMSEEGFDSNMLRHMIYPSDYAPRAILENANWGKYAVVAVGSTANGCRSAPPRHVRPLIPFAGKNHVRAQKLLVVHAPGPHLQEERDEATAHLRQGILDAGRHFAVDFAVHEPVGLQFAQLAGQHALGHVGMPRLSSPKRTAWAKDR